MTEGHCRVCKWKENLYGGVCEDCWCVEHSEAHIVTCDICGNDRPNAQRHTEIQVCKDCDIEQANDMTCGRYRTRSERLAS